MAKIITVPNPILRKKSEAVTDFGNATKNLIEEMIKTLTHSDNPKEEVKGVGLAAPQIGISKRVVLARKVNARGEDGEIVTLVNPEIIGKSASLEAGLEGCLSIPGLYGEVNRYVWIEIKSKNNSGKSIKLRAEGFFARVIQHEIDHLDGVLFTDKLLGKLYTAKELDSIPAE